MAHGYSGTTWIAHALNQATYLTARHESMGHELGEGFDGVESNGHLWGQIPEIRERYPDAAVIHQVRNGRLVIRSHLARHPERTFGQVCERWQVVNDRLAQAIPSADRYRLEDLVTDFDAFRRLAERCGAGRVDRQAWERVRTTRVNALRKGHWLPPPAHWPTETEATFWRICGETMEAMGYA